MARYDRAITVFSRDGHLFQVKYALEAVHRGMPPSVFAELIPSYSVLRRSLLLSYKIQDLHLYVVVERGGKNIEVAVMTREHGLRQLEEAEIDAIVAEIEAEKEAGQASKIDPPKET